MTIHAFTELHSDYPAYINLSEQPDGTIKVTVRTRGRNGSECASIGMTALQIEELADAIYKHNYKGEGEIDTTHPAPEPDVTTVANVPTWQERMPAPRRAFQCDMNCGGVGLGKVVDKGCGDCMPIIVHGDPIVARDAEIAALRALAAERGWV